MATTSKEGSRRVNYPILTQGGSDNKSQCGTMFCNWIENNVQTLSINNWRASLVPAAAVIPAPIAYIKVAAVKKLVVGSWDRAGGPPRGELPPVPAPVSRRPLDALN